MSREAAPRRMSRLGYMWKSKPGYKALGLHYPENGTRSRDGHVAVVITKQKKKGMYLRRDNQFFERDLSTDCKN